MRLTIGHKGDSLSETRSTAWSKKDDPPKIRGTRSIQEEIIPSESYLETVFHPSVSEIKRYGTRIICLSGPSGIGKDETLERLVTKDMGKWQCKRIPLVTTRPPRPDEDPNAGLYHGDDFRRAKHIFVPVDEFNDMKDVGMFVAWRLRDTGHYYGLMATMVEAVLSQPYTIGLIASGLRMGGLIKQSYGGLPTLLFGTSSPENLEKWYRLSKREENEKSQRLDLATYSKLAPLLADHLILINEQEEYYPAAEMIIEIVKRQLAGAL